MFLTTADLNNNNTEFDVVNPTFTWLWLTVELGFDNWKWSITDKLHPNRGWFKTSQKILHNTYEQSLIMATLANVKTPADAVCPSLPACDECFNILCFFFFNEFSLMSGFEWAKYMIDDHRVWWLIIMLLFSTNVRTNVSFGEFSWNLEYNTPGTSVGSGDRDPMLVLKSRKYS